MIFLELNAWNYGKDMSPLPDNPTVQVYVNAALIASVHHVEGEEGGSLIRMHGGGVLMVQENPLELVSRAEEP